MMKKLGILLLFVSAVHAEIPKECQLVDDTSETLMQLRQSGLSLDDIDLNPEALSEQEAQLLKAMIADAKLVPVYKIPLTRQKAIEDFKEKWMQSCMSSNHGVDENKREAKLFESQSKS